MRCLNPVHFKSLSFPCGRCIACRLNKQREWAFRISHEAKLSPDNVFVTLTYDDKKDGPHITLKKRDCQLFLKRLRKNLGRQIRFFLSGEYGEKGGRPHYHLIIFGLRKEEENIIRQSWKHGFVSVGDVSLSSINYVAKYTLKKVSGVLKEEYAKQGKIPEFSLMSRKPGIGWNFAKKSKSLFNNGFGVFKSSKIPLPRFYVDKLFSEEDKEKRRLKNQDFVMKRLIEEGLSIGIKSKMELYKVGQKRREQSPQARMNIESRLNLKKGKL